jgi:predicted DNA-binding protein (MmcQ/YjbR family)
VLLSLIDDSYRLVLTGLSRKIRVELTSKEGATP